jgi:hypothetical protein
VYIAGVDSIRFDRRVAGSECSVWFGGVLICFVLLFVRKCELNHMRFFIIRALQIVSATATATDLTLIIHTPHMYRMNNALGSGPINLVRFVRKSGSNDVPHDPVQTEPCSIWLDRSWQWKTDYVRTGRGDVYPAGVVNRLGETSSESKGETHGRAKSSSCVDAGRWSNDHRVLVGGRVGW